MSISQMIDYILNHPGTLVSRKYLENCKDESIVALYHTIKEHTKWEQW